MLPYSAFFSWIHTVAVLQGILTIPTMFLGENTSKIQHHMKLLTCRVYRYWRVGTLSLIIQIPPCTWGLSKIFFLVRWRYWSYWVRKTGLLFPKNNATPACSLCLVLQLAALFTSKEMCSNTRTNRQTGVVLCFSNPVISNCEYLVL